MKLVSCFLALSWIGIGAAQAVENGIPQIDPTALPDVDIRISMPPPVSPEVSVMSVQCAVPHRDLATSAPLLNRTSEELGIKKHLRILAIGSSSTWGSGASSLKRNYPSRLEVILSRVWKGVELEIVNRGVGGEVASQTAARLLDEINLIKPDLILWQVGANDGTRGVPVEKFETTVRQTIAEVRRNKIDLVLVGLQYTPKYERNEHYGKIRKSLQTIARSEKVLLVRRYSAMEFIARTKANLPMLSKDNFHLNDLGYQCMAEHIAQAVVANLFVRKRDRRGLPEITQSASR